MKVFLYDEKRKKKILTGICTNVPLFSVGCENNGITGIDPFLMKIGPCIGVTAESFWSVKEEEEIKVRKSFILK